MRKFKWALGMLLLALVPILAWVSVARAQHFGATVDENQTIHSSVYSVGKEVSIKGTIYGDVFCAGQKVTVDATVYGDVICAGMDVTISGKVEGDVRAAGQLVTLSGAIGKSATVAAMNFSLDADAKVGQDLTANGTELNIKGSVGRDVVASGNNVTINGSVARNVKATTGNLQLKDRTLVSGGLYYTSGREAKIDQKAAVKGKTERTTPKNSDRGYSFNVIFYLFVVVSLTIIGLALAFLFPRFLQRTTDELVASAPKALATGLIGGLLAIAIPIGLLISLVGIPLGLVILLSGLVGAVLSGPIAAYWVGRMVFRNKQVSPVLIALIGGPILITLYFLPWVGWLVMLVAYWFGFGALLLALRPFVGNRAAAATASASVKSGKKK
jgi:cytoskeletal protein CcmA (bactofilin family)